MPLWILVVPFTVIVVVGTMIVQLYRERRRLEQLRRGIEAREAWFKDRAIALLAAARKSPLNVVERVEAAALKMSPAVEAVIFAEMDGDALIVRHARGMHAGFLLHMRLDPAGRSALSLAMRAGHRVATGTIGVERLFGEGAYLAVPLITRGHAVGVFCFTAACAIDLGDQDALVALIELAAPAYEIALERRADVTAASIDGLTGLLSPVVFRRRLTEELLKASRRNISYALLFLDTDHFKICNDTLGHAAGDAVLTSIASILMKCGGPEAIVGRNGGDEFCLALPGTKSAALRVAELTRLEIAQYPYTETLGVELPKPITASIGVAVYPEDAKDATHLLEAADKAMYCSKRGGRNRVSLLGLDDR